MALVYSVLCAALDAGANAYATLAQAKVIQPAKAASTKSTSKAKTEVEATEDTKDIEDK